MTIISQSFAGKKIQLKKKLLKFFFVFCLAKFVSKETVTKKKIHIFLKFFKII